MSEYAVRHIAYCSDGDMELRSNDRKYLTGEGTDERSDGYPGYMYKNTDHVERIEQPGLDE